jgi:hypothetical protein
MQTYRQTVAVCWYLLLRSYLAFMGTCFRLEAVVAPRISAFRAAVFSVITIGMLIHAILQKMSVMLQVDVLLCNAVSVAALQTMKTVLMADACPELEAE